jgi:FKBP-type peptidyl-prolyl cis-trans isomerase 2
MDPHANEAAGAIAGMTQTYGYRPQPGDRVRAERPFYGDAAIGTVLSVTGNYVLVDLLGEHLAYRPDELEYVGRRIN